MLDRLIFEQVEGQLLWLDDSHRLLMYTDCLFIEGNRIGLELFHPFSNIADEVYSHQSANIAILFLISLRSN